MGKDEKTIKKELVEKGIIPSSKRFVFPIVIVILAIATALGTFYYLYKKDLEKESVKANRIVVEETPTEITYVDPFADSTNKSGWQTHQFSSQYVNFSFQTPDYLKVGEVNNEFSIQDYPIGAPPPDNYFKMTLETNQILETKTQKQLESELFYPKEKPLGNLTFFEGITVDRKLLSVYFARNYTIEATTHQRNEVTEKLTDDILSTIVIE